MNWKKWKLGLVIAAITGLGTTFMVGNVDPNLSIKNLIFLTLGFIFKDVLLYLMKHPVDSISFGDTQFITKDAVKESDDKQNNEKTTPQS